jgi:hypothetical protein
MEYEISLLILVLFLAIAPHVLWIRWIIRAIRKRQTLGRVLAPLSYVFFLVPGLYLLTGSRRSYMHIFDAAQVDENFLLVIFLLSFLLPAGYFYGRWVYTAYRQKTRKAVYFRLSFLLLFPAVGVVVHISSELDHRSKISADLGVAIPYWGTSITKYSDNISSFRGEGELLAEIELNQGTFEDLAQQIRQSAYYDSSRLELYGADGIEWPKSDTVFYWTVRNHMEAQHLTGLWVYDQQRAVYEFYEPSLSDIPNASILFKESYVLSAELNLKSRILTFKRWKF